MEVPLYFATPSARPVLPQRTSLLAEALESTIRLFPPSLAYDVPPKGFWSGPTGIAYLFLHVAHRQPSLIINNKPAIAWAKSYLSHPLCTDFEPNKFVGIRSEPMVYHAVRAAVFQDLAAARELAELVNVVLAQQTEVEWHSGRAGTLYLIRLAMHWLLDSKPLFDDAVARLSASILNEGPDWRFHGNRYIGAVHGDIGTIAQAALSDVSVSSKGPIVASIERLLDWQKDDGNWAVNDEVDPKPYVQFCHGAPGFVVALKSIRHLFPELKERMDIAIQKAQALIRKEGLLKKEPSLCHGLLGNGLCLSPEDRQIFLAYGTPSFVEECRRADATMFTPGSSGFDFSFLTGYWPGAAWTWLVMDDIEPAFIGFNDI